jgi:hypothetical protein
MSGFSIAGFLDFFLKQQVKNYYFTDKKIPAKAGILS